MVGKDVYNFRKRKGIEKKQLAYLMDCHPRTIYNLELNEGRAIKDDYIFAIMELDKMIPDIKDVLKTRLEEMRQNGHRI